MSSLSAPRFPIYVTGSTEAPRALVVLQEGFGVNDHLRSVADRFAVEGLFVVAPHLYHRHGAPEVPYDDVEQAVSLMSTLTLEGLTNDLFATSDFLRTSGYEATSVGVVGFCMGGSVAFFAATLERFGAAVTFYGGGLRTSRMGLAPLLELAPSLQVPWLGLFGDLDTGIPVDDVEALRDATNQVAIRTEIVRYPEAGHGFFCDARPSHFHEVSSRDALTRATSFLSDVLTSR